MSKSIQRLMVIILAGALWPVTVMAAREEILLNESFEYPEMHGKMELDEPPSEWHPFSTDPNKVLVGLTSSIARTGKQALRIKSHGVPDSYQGVFQSFAVEGGEVYEFIVYVRMDSHRPFKGTQRGEIHIEFRDKNDEEIKRVLGPEWRKALSANKWTKMDMETKVPDEAARAHFVITQLDGLNPLGQDQSFLVDDTSVKRKR